MYYKTRRRSHHTPLIEENTDNILLLPSADAWAFSDRKRFHLVLRDVPLLGRSSAPTGLTCSSAGESVTGRLASGTTSPRTRSQQTSKRQRGATLTGSAGGGGDGGGGGNVEGNNETSRRRLAAFLRGKDAAVQDSARIGLVAPNSPGVVPAARGRSGLKEAHEGSTRYCGCTRVHSTVCWARFGVFAFPPLLPGHTSRG